MFIGREYELSVLDNTYNKTGFLMTIIYGRRRIGKSRLITEFIKGKKASYYVATKSSVEDNIKKWSAQFILDIMPDMSGVEFSDLEDFLKFAGNSCRDERIVLALDEIPYIAEADESFLSRFQRAIDLHLSKTNIYLIICGSAISFMEREILSEKSPLYGRRDNQIYLKPFDYLDSARFVPNYSNEEKAIVYGVTGGVAKYLTLFDDRESLDDNLVNNFFTTSGYLYEEPYNLLMQEFRNVNTYNTIIEACARGANKVNEIADKVHGSSAAVSYAIRNLSTIGVLKRISSITEEKNKKKVSYEIVDGMYRFWYQFIPKGQPAIETNRGEVYYNKYVRDNIHDFMSDVFENMCRYYLLTQALDGKFQCMTTKVGKWWGIDRDRVPTDIDVVGIDEVKRKAILGECKFKNEQIDKPIYDSLINKKGLIDRKYDEVGYMYFSLSGFSEWVETNADSDKVSLVTLDDMYKQ